MIDEVGKRMTTRPESIENRWDILYEEYPEVYDEFASVPYRPDWVVSLSRILEVDWNGKTVVDVGSGSGLSTFDLARHAELVIGVEPSDAMREIAVRNAKKRKIGNVRFVKGRAEKIPIKERTVDLVVAFTAPLDYKESTRVAKKDGVIISIDVAPKWYGGELAPVICGETRITEEDSAGKAHKKYSELNFKYKDFFQIQEYGSLDKIIGTYGFIFGKKAIDYLKKHDKTSIKWKWRIHYKKIK